MSDFADFSDEIAEGMDVLEHFGILGQKWGKKNGPPYPLDSDDHSSGEKTAAKAAGVKVGSDSGKGSIANVKKKPVKKVELTPEQKREQALAAARSGDKKKIAKNVDDLTTEELRDAAERARLKDQLTREEPGQQKLTKAERDKQEAIKSGDKEKVKEYANQMSYQELREAMDKIDLTAKLNYVAPPPSTLDRIKAVADKVDTMRGVAEKGISAYNVMAKIYNSSHKGEAQWPIIGEKPKEEKDKEKDKDKDSTSKAIEKLGKELKNTINENSGNRDTRTMEQKFADELKAKKLGVRNDEKFDRWLARRAKGEIGEDDEIDEPKPAAQNETKSSNNHEYIKKEGEGEDAKYTYKEDAKSEKESKMEQHESNKNLGIHRFSESTLDRLQQITSQKGNKLGVAPAFTNENYSRGPQPKSVNWHTGINAESATNWRSTWNSVADVDNTRSISDDLTPAEQAFLDSFKKR